MSKNTRKTKQIVGQAALSFSAKVIAANATAPATAPAPVTTSASALAKASPQK